jgi:hypothetical protein
MFEKVIVGSSPIAMMHAISYKNKGFKTALINDGYDLGGAWAIHEWANIGYTEKACHLIEYYKGAYEILERISGCKFKKLEPQPLKVWGRGLELSYSSKKWFIFQFFKLIPRGLARLIIKLILLIKRFEVPTKNEINHLFRDINLLIFLFKHRIISLLENQDVKGPEGGWLAFTDALIKKLEGVEVVNERVQKVVEQIDGRWLVYLNENNYFFTNELIITESADCLIIDNSNKMHTSTLHNENITTNFYHLLVTIDESRLIFSNPYLHFPDNVNIKRITAAHPYGFGLKERSPDCEFIEKKIDGSFEILVQLRKPPDKIENISLVIAQLIFNAGMTDSLCEVTIHDYFTESRLMAGNERVSPGVYNNLLVLKSVGDLGISVLKQKDTLC